MPTLAFSKYSGCGNDFILFDNRAGIFPAEDKTLIRNLCRRRLGIGADGVILLENSIEADFRMRIFNADASEAEMCGNGLRCFGKFLFELGLGEENFRVEVMRQIYSLQLRGDVVSVSMPPPGRTEWQVEFSLDGNLITADFLDTGVPHVVIFTDGLENVDLSDLGPKIRRHPRFSPKGANVNFASLDTEGFVSVRTYERGVEEETLACGTGAAAVAIAAAKKYALENPITVRPRSGEELKFYLAKENGEISRITMNGPANFIFHGEISIALEKR